MPFTQTELIMLQMHEQTPARATKTYPLKRTTKHNKTATRDNPFNSVNPNPRAKAGKDARYIVRTTAACATRA